MRNTTSFRVDHSLISALEHINKPDVKSNYIEKRGGYGGYDHEHMVEFRNTCNKVFELHDNLEAAYPSITVESKDIDIILDYTKVLKEMKLL